MNAMHLAQRMTADEYLALPYGGIRTMLVDGEVVVNQPSGPHQLVLRAVFRALDGWALASEGHGEVMWPLDVKLDERNVFGPDLLWYAGGRAVDFDAKAPYPVPDLAVEVRSPSTWRYDVGAKLLAYERAGLAELWLVDTVARAILVWRRSTSTAATFDEVLELGVEDTVTSPQLAGFALAVSSLFAG